MVARKHYPSVAAVLLALACSPVAAQQFGLGTPATPEQIAGWNIEVAPDGKNLPQGSGTIEMGKKVYETQCLACHGANLEGGIGDRLIGGRGTLAKSDQGGAPIKTVESYWPYATTLFDYIKRAMPFTAPNTMSDDDVYAVTAYILAKAKIIPDNATMDQQSLPSVLMPNRDGFRPADR